MTGSERPHRVADPHPEDEEGKPPLDPRGPSYAQKELRDNMTVNDYTHDDDGQRVGGAVEKNEGRPAEERNAEFLVEEFDIHTHEAATLVTDIEPDAERIEAHERQRQREDDPLEEVPAPDTPDMSPDERVQKHMHKEVVRVKKT